MRVCILDFDGSLSDQRALRHTYDPVVIPLREWGPSLRIACSHRRLEPLLVDLSRHQTGSPTINLYGSGDFHHVTLALLGLQTQPCNLLVLDNHPDWMRGVPLIHCGTWLYHAARLHVVQRVYHVGGEVDFDNAYGWLAPWDLLECGKIKVFPARRIFRGHRWSRVPHSSLRTAGDVSRVIDPITTDLARYPLYISIDKDVLSRDDAIVNWDSGQLTLDEIESVLRAFIQAANGNLAGVDLLGDWSPVRTAGMLRRLLHYLHHPKIHVDREEAARVNKATNLRLLGSIFKAVQSSRSTAA